MVICCEIEDEDEDEDQDEGENENENESENFNKMCNTMRRVIQIAINFNKTIKIIIKINECDIFTVKKD